MSTQEKWLSSGQQRFKYSYRISIAIEPMQALDESLDFGFERTEKDEMKIIECNGSHNDDDSVTSRAIRNTSFFHAKVPPTVFIAVRIFSLISFHRFIVIFGSWNIQNAFNSLCSSETVCVCVCELTRVYCVCLRTLFSKMIVSHVKVKCKHGSSRPSAFWAEKRKKKQQQPQHDNRSERK